MITIKLLSTQIGTYWELIKYAASKAVELDEKDLQAGLIWLLHQLLSDKAQCWFRLDDKRQVVAVVITRLEVDTRINSKSLYVYVVFSYRHVPLEQWKEDFEILKGFAKKEGCREIAFATRNPKMMEMDLALGCRQSYTSFVYDLE